MAQEKSATQPNPIKKAWRYLDRWNIGISGKVIIILIVIGIISKIIERLS